MPQLFPFIDFVREIVASFSAVLRRDADKEAALSLQLQLPPYRSLSSTWRRSTTTPLQDFCRVPTRRRWPFRYSVFLLKGRACPTCSQQRAPGSEARGLNMPNTPRHGDPAKAIYSLQKGRAGLVAVLNSVLVPSDWVPQVALAISG